MARTILNITLFTLLSGLSLLGQTNPGNLFYDIGLMIEDSNKVAPDPTVDDMAFPVLNQEQEVLEEELNRYQIKLAETEMRLRFQTSVIDSLQTEIALIRAAGKTDRALLTNKITSLVDQHENDSKRPAFVPGNSNTSDSVFAELNTPWRNAKTQSSIIRPDAPKMSSSEEQTAYRNGLTKFHQQFYYQAIDEFNSIVLRGVDMTMRANAQYWVGRCYYEKGLYDEAISALEQVQRYEHSDKLDDALVMIGLSFKSKDRLPEAKLAFQELVSRHPGSEYLTLARRFVQE